MRQLAQQLAQKPYQAPDQSLPDNLKKLDYDQYRKIRYIPDKALWRNDGLPFQIQFFHRGFFYSNRVEIFEVGRRTGDAGSVFAKPVHLRRHQAATA